MRRKREPARTLRVATVGAAAGRGRCRCAVLYGCASPIPDRAGRRLISARLRARMTHVDSAGRRSPSIGLICRGHRAVALENLALRQQLAAFTLQNARSFNRVIDSFGFCSRNPGETGAAPCLSSSPTPSCAGIAIGCDAAGPNDHARRGRVARGPTRRFGRWSIRWCPQILSGARRAFMGNCANSASTSRNEPSRGSSARASDRHHRHGEPSLRITSPRSSQWTSSRCRH